VKDHKTNIHLGDGKPTQRELGFHLVDNKQSTDRNFYVGRASFDFRSVESKTGVYLPVPTL
jgi:hypothetical protein